MKGLLDKSEKNVLNGQDASSEINNIMRLVQGTVMPQVNAGVAEVAKVFLNKPERMVSAVIESTESSSSVENAPMEVNVSSPVITMQQQITLQVCLCWYCIYCRLYVILITYSVL